MSLVVVIVFARSRKPMAASMFSACSLVVYFVLLPGYDGILGFNCCRLLFTASHFCQSGTPIHIHPPPL